jgi:aspartate racemase
MNKPTLGIIGGVGPMATAYFMELVIDKTPAKADQDNLPMIVFNDPQIPDRTDFILGRSDKNPVPEMVKVARWLERAGADYIAIPCNTAHFFYDEICAAVRIPVLNIMRETTALLAGAGVSGGTVGLMATEGTVHSGVFQSYLAEDDISVMVPDADDQAIVTSLIYDQVKQNKPYDVDAFLAVASRLRDRGADAVIVGCTELSVIYQDLREKPDYFVDSLDALAQRCVDYYFEHRA